MTKPTKRKFPIWPFVVFAVSSFLSWSLIMYSIGHSSGHHEALTFMRDLYKDCYKVRL